MEPCGTLTVSSCERSWSLAIASSMRSFSAASSACLTLFSLRRLRRPVDSRDASSTASRASSSACHAAVAVLLLGASAAGALLAPARVAVRLVGRRRGLLGRRRAGRALCRTGLALLALGGTGLPLLALGRGATLALALGLLLGGLLGLLLQDLLLLGDLVEQAREGLDRLGGGVLDAVALGLLGGCLLGGDALLLGLLARGLCGGTLALLLGPLLLAALLGLDAVLLGLLGGGTRLLVGCGALGALGRLDLGGASLEDRLELLADDRDVGVLERRRRRLGWNLHVREVIEHLLARHAIFLGKVMYSSLCHVTNLPEFGLAPR